MCVLQMSTRQEQRQGEQLRLNLDLLDDQKAEAEYDEMLEQEAARMSVRGYTPKVCGQLLLSWTLPESEHAFVVWVCDQSQGQIIA